MRKRRLFALSHIVLLTGGLLAGASFQISRYLISRAPDSTSVIRSSELLPRVALGALGATLAFYLLHWLTLLVVRRLPIDAALKRRYLELDFLSYLPFLLMPLAGLGLRFNSATAFLLLVLFVSSKLAIVLSLLPNATRSDFLRSREWLAFLFLFSGIAALIYQIVWQRVLFSAFGVNIESITLIVAIFMFGLGCGALLGGWISKRFSAALPVAFLACELIIGLFGLVSIPLIRQVSELVITQSLVVIGSATFLLLCIPTIFMGATLPILVSYLVERLGHVGSSVGVLYFFNTIGSAIAAVATVELVFLLTGLQGAVLFAALCNFVVGALVYRYIRTASPSPDFP
jgi:hypothetical protein